MKILDQSIHSKHSFVMLIGLSGSGKTSWVRELGVGPNEIYLNADSMRAILGSGEGDQTVNKQVFSTLKTMFKYSLFVGHSIILDNTNLTRETRKDWIKMAKDAGYEITAIVFDVPLEQCLENIGKRIKNNGLHVPKEIVEKQFQKFQVPDLSEGFDFIDYLDNTGNFIDLEDAEK